MDDLNRRFSNLNIDPPGRRLDETDNKFYTFRQFIEFYGENDGRYFWSIAPKEEDVLPPYESSEPESYSEDDSEYDSEYDSGYDTDEAYPHHNGGRKNKTKSRRKKKKGRKSRRKSRKSKRKSRKGKKKRKIRKKKTRRRKGGASGTHSSLARRAMCQKRGGTWRNNKCTFSNPQEGSGKSRRRRRKR